MAKTKQEEINDLRKELKEVYMLLEKSQKRVSEMQQAADEAFMNSLYRVQMEKELAKYKSLYEMTQANYNNLSSRHEELKGRYTALQSQKKAGRKPKNEAWKNQYQKFIEMLEAEKSMEEIMMQLEISRATYFRLKKLSKSY